MFIVLKSSYDAALKENAALTNKVQQLEEQLRQMSRYVDELQSQKAAAEQKAKDAWDKYLTKAVDRDYQNQEASQLRTHLAQLFEGTPSQYLQLGAVHWKVTRINSIKSNADGYVRYINDKSVTDMVAEGMDPIRIKADDLVKLITMMERNQKG